MTDVNLFAGESLRSSFGEMSERFSERFGASVTATFGPSGLLAERIARGERCCVFAAADLASAESVAAKTAAPVIVFARNMIGALANARLKAATTSLLSLMLDPRIRLGIATPKASPAGDSAWEIFRRADIARPGSFAVLSAKALKLVGGRDSPQPPRGQDLYVWLIESDQVDIFLTYRTNAMPAARSSAALDFIELPDILSIGTDYGLIVTNDQNPLAAKFALFVMSPEGQRILGRHGFKTVNEPALRPSIPDLRP
ncbi:MAG: substrate-binding domain-containing protein [Alphaproteobacteria bacterium]